MNTMFRLLVAVLSLLVYTATWAGAPSGIVCPRALEMEALDVAGTVRDWSSLYDAYSKYQKCDDGAIAEGFTESVVRMLADDWKSAINLAPLAKRDRRFLDFVYRHINESADEKDLEKIIENFKTVGCKGTPRSICVRIKQRADTALKAMK